LELINPLNALYLVYLGAKMSHRDAFLVGILGIHGILVYVPTGILLRKSSDAELFRRTMLTWKKWFGVRCGSQGLVTPQKKIDRMSNDLGDNRWKKRIGGLNIHLSRRRIFRQEMCVKINLGFSRLKGFWGR